jgi:hypothetical protein
MTKGVVPKEVVTQAIDTAKVAQIVHLIKENQLVTAFCLFVLWQTGALLSAATYVQGGVC